MTTRNSHCPVLLLKNRMYLKKNLSSVLHDEQTRYHISLLWFWWNTERRRQPDLTPPIKIRGPIDRNRQGLLIHLSSGGATAKICSWNRWQTFVFLAKINSFYPINHSQLCVLIHIKLLLRFPGEYPKGYLECSTKHTTLCSPCKSKLSELY